MCEVLIEINVIKYVEGFCLIKMGDIYVFCIVILEDCVLLFIKGLGLGWVIVEYGMLLCLILLCMCCEVVVGK